MQFPLNIAHIPARRRDHFPSAGNCTLVSIPNPAPPVNQVPRKKTLRTAGSATPAPPLGLSGPTATTRRAPWSEIRGKNPPSLDAHGWAAPPVPFRNRNAPVASHLQPLGTPPEATERADIPKVGNRPGPTGRQSPPPALIPPPLGAEESLNPIVCLLSSLLSPWVQPNLNPTSKEASHSGIPINPELYTRPPFSQGFAAFVFCESLDISVPAKTSETRDWSQTFSHGRTRSPYSSPVSPAPTSDKRPAPHHPTGSPSRTHSTPLTPSPFRARLRWSAWSAPPRQQSPVAKTHDSTPSGD